MDNMDSLINLKELLDSLTIKFGGEEIFLMEDNSEKIPRPPETIKRDISRAKNGFEVKTLNVELNDSYKYYNGLSKETKEKIKREQRITNQVHNMLKDEREFMTEEEYNKVFEEEYKLVRAEELDREIRERLRFL